MSLKLERFSAGYRSWQTQIVSLEIPTHGLTALLGPNGSGKTTLLNGMMGLISHKGSIAVDDMQLGTAESKVLSQHLSYLPQRYQFTYPISVEDVILMGFNPEMRLFERYSQKHREQAREGLRQIGLETVINDDFLRLSEGQRQRVMLARSLVQNTSVLLLDEPDSAMDFSVRHEVMTLLRTIIRRDLRCGLVVLHDPSLALKYCDRIELFKNGSIIGNIMTEVDDSDTIRQKLSLLYGNIGVYRTPDGHYIIDAI